MNTLLVVCCLIGLGAASVPTKVVLSKNLQASVHEIASRYGLSNGDALKLVKLSDPKTEILDELESLLTQLRADQNKADADYESFLGAKGAEKEALEAALAQQKQDLVQDQNELAQIEGDYATSKALIEQKSKEAADDDSQVKLYEALVSQIKDERAAHKAQFDDVIKQHDDSLATLGELIDMVSNFQFDDALAKLSAQRHGFVHRKAQSFMAVVQAAVELMQKKKGKKGPTKNEIRDTLLGLLNKIRQGTEDSRALYVSAEEEEVAKFNLSLAEYTTMITSYSKSRDDALDIVATEGAKGASLEAAIGAKHDEIGRDQDAIQSTQQSLDDLATALADAQGAHQAQSETRAHDLSDVNKAIEYVNEHVEGMTVKELCHVGAPNCYRCLTHDQCGNGDFCSDNGQCESRPKPVMVGGTTSENQSLTLACPEGKTISSINFASYGMPNGEFPNFQQGWCHSPSSFIVVSNACVGQQSCTVQATNDVFGDPCYGTYKHMDIAAVCQ